MDLFSEAVIEHIVSPRNVGEMPDAHGVGIGGEPGCGDWLIIFIKVKDNMISDISFLVHGCVAAIATSSVTTELAKGKALDEAYRITEHDIVNALGGLPEYKLHCSILGATALKKAIDDYRKLAGKENG